MAAPRTIAFVGLLGGGALAAVTFELGRKTRSEASDASPSVRLRGLMRDVAEQGDASGPGQSERHE
ncbi:MAG: hypothetical protein JWP14_549 [Frankiales bacterium]|nr:hypothetical protein [Frankiales bacterium]